jgi:hypothetical protein
MLTPDEQRFIEYWEVERLRKHRIFNLATGLRLGVFIVVAIFINIITGWHKRAAMVIGGNSSVIFVILVAAIGIVVFISAFSAQYQREQKEQQYKELLAKKERLETSDPISTQNEELH